jgi:hypothetical protein
MKTYYIYHIPGVKIGVSTNAEKRVNEQGYTEFEILEEHTDIHLVSDREQELQKEYGYSVDRSPYYNSYIQRMQCLSKTIETNKRSGHTKRWLQAGGSAQGNINAQNGTLIRASKAAVESPNNIHKQIWLLPDGTTTNGSWWKRMCIKKNLNPDLCVRIK